MNEMLNYLLKIAKNKDIAVEIVEDHCIIPTCSVPKEKYIFLNFTGIGEKYWAFRLAHEIAHIVNEDELRFSCDTQVVDAQREYRAHKTAVGLIYQYTQDCGIHFDNLYDFLNFGGIPFDMADYAYDLFAKSAKSNI